VHFGLDVEQRRRKYLALKPSGAEVLKSGHSGHRRAAGGIQGRVRRGEHDHLPVRVVLRHSLQVIRQVQVLGIEVRGPLTVAPRCPGRPEYVGRRLPRDAGARRPRCAPKRPARILSRGSIGTADQSGTRAAASVLSILSLRVQSPRTSPVEHGSSKFAGVLTRHRAWRVGSRVSRKRRLRLLSAAERSALRTAAEGVPARALTLAAVGVAPGCGLLF
jgi:hypothetical protein